MPIINMAGNALGYAGQAAAAAVATSGEAQYQRDLTSRLNTRERNEALNQRSAMAVAERARENGLREARRRAGALEKILERGPELGYDTTYGGYERLRSDLRELSPGMADQIDREYGVPESEQDIAYPLIFDASLSAVVGLEEQREERLKSEVRDTFADKARTMDATAEEVSRAASIAGSNLPSGELSARLDAELEAIGEARVAEQADEYARNEAKRLMTADAKSVSSPEARELYGSILSKRSKNPQADLAKLRVLTSDGPEGLKAIELDALNIGIMDGYKRGREAALRELRSSGAGFQDVFGNPGENPPPTEMKMWETSGDESYRERQSEDSKRFFGNPEGARLPGDDGSGARISEDRTPFLSKAIFDNSLTGFADAIRKRARDEQVDLSSPHGRAWVAKTMRAMGFGPHDIYQSLLFKTSRYSYESGEEIEIARRMQDEPVLRKFLKSAEVDLKDREAVMAAIQQYDFMNDPANADTMKQLDSTTAAAPEELDWLKSANPNELR